jgi:hypothetical protein
MSIAGPASNGPLTKMALVLGCAHRIRRRRDGDGHVPEEITLQEHVQPRLDKYASSGGRWSLLALIGARA